MFTITVLGAKIIADTIGDLRRKFSALRDDNFFGASDIGAQFVVKHGSKRVGVLSYNGKYTEGSRDEWS